MGQKLATIKLQGKDYCQVKDRVKAFNEEYPNGSIVTEPKFVTDLVTVKATVTPDCSKPERFFTAHSFGSLKGSKAFEKQETIAVGRALAYLGFGIDGSVASSDEMEVFYKEEIIETQRFQTYLQKLVNQLPAESQERFVNGLGSQYGAESITELTLAQTKEIVAKMTTKKEP
jgi:hypothetical protein